MDLKHYPKIELHAHLSGSISEVTINKLLDIRKRLQKDPLPSNMQLSLATGHERTLKQTFDVFRAIHALTDNYEAICVVTEETLKEFAADNVAYLELRTTPRAVKGSYSKEQYLEIILNGIIEIEKKETISIRLLISLDRGKTLEENNDNFKIARQFYEHERYGKFVCGIDVSGKPGQNSLQDFVSILQEAKRIGMKSAVHLLEINTNEAIAEARHLIELDLVDRLGHGTFLHPESGGCKDLCDLVKKKEIPLEICITSNLKTGTVQSLQNHHVKFWWNDKHPIAICTDDKGVFCTTLTEEYELFMTIIQGTMTNLKKMSEDSINGSFLTEMEKKSLKDLMAQYFRNDNTSI